MKQTNLLTRMLLLCLMIVGSASVWAAELTSPWTHTFSTTEKTFTQDETKTLNNVDWALAVTWEDSSNKDYNVDSNGGMKIGSNKKVPSGMTLSTSGFPGTIKKVSVTTYGRSKSTCTVEVKVNGTTYTTTDTWGGNTSKKLNYEGASSGKIEIIWTQGTSNKGAFYVTDITVEFEDETITKHTLSSAVSPVGVGTVTLGATEVGEGKNTTIVAEATNPAYQFKNWTATSGTIADANAASTTFTMGTEDATVTANFEEKPTHAINITSTADGAITVKNGDDEIASGDKIYEGATLTISAEAGKNREFASWSVTGATPASTTENPTTLTVGTDDITIAATFNTITTHKISWSVNDVIVKSENIKEGDAITFAAPESGIPEGYVYKGWVVEDDKINTPTDDDPKAKYVTSGTSTVDITYYCVMAKETGTEGSATLTAANWSSSSTTYGYHTYTDDQGNNWSGNTQQPKDNNVSRIGLRSTSGSYLESPTFPGNITEIKVMTYNGSSSDRTLNLNSAKDKNNGDLGTIPAPKNTMLTAEQTATLTGTSFKKFYMIPKADAIGFSYITVKYGSVTTSNYCTTVPTIEKVTKLADRTYGTYVTKNALDFTGADVEAYIAKGITGEGDAATLEIEKVTTVKAGTPIIVKSDDKSVTSANVKIITDAEAANNGDNKLVAGDGTDVTTDVAYTYYYIASDKFHKATTGSLVVGKAYLKLETASAKAFTIAIGGDGETTGINTLDSRLSTLDKAQSMYNLAGQKVSNSYKGIVIINGKKVIK